MNMPRNTIFATGIQGPQRRLYTKPVSSGMFPYQITWNWLHMR